MNIVNQLPADYPFLNYDNEDWSMYVDINKPYRVRFVHGLIQVIYEYSNKEHTEIRMTTMVATLSDRQIIVDPTNNIYFNLRSHGNLSTVCNNELFELILFFIFCLFQHYLNLSLSNPIIIKTGQKNEQDRLIQSQQVDKLTNVNNYFYKLNRAGIGKNYIATYIYSKKKQNSHIKHRFFVCI